MPEKGQPCRGDGDQLDEMTFSLSPISPSVAEMIGKFRQCCELVRSL